MSFTDIPIIFGIESFSFMSFLPMSRHLLTGSTILRSPYFSLIPVRVSLGHLDGDVPFRTAAWLTQAIEFMATADGSHAHMGRPNIGCTVGIDPLASPIYRTRQLIDSR